MVAVIVTDCPTTDGAAELVTPTPAVTWPTVTVAGVVETCCR